MHQPVPTAARTAVRTRFYVGQLPYLVAFGVAFVSAPAAVIITAVVAIYYIFERAPARQQRPREPAGQPDQPEPTERTGVLNVRPAGTGTGHRERSLSASAALSAG